MSVVFVAASQLPTPFALFTMHGFLDEATGKEHIALTLGDFSDGAPVLGRLHSECLTGDALFSLRCDCGFQLRMALERIAQEGRGVLLYLRQEGRGIGLANKVRAYALQDEGADTVDANHQLGFPADDRDYSLAVALLRDLALCRIRLMTNNPAKLEALVKDGVDVVERVAIERGRNPYNAEYLDTKMNRMGHLIGARGEP